MNRLPHPIRRAASASLVALALVVVFAASAPGLGARFARKRKD